MLARSFPRPVLYLWFFTAAGHAAGHMQGAAKASLARPSGADTTEVLRLSDRCFALRRSKPDSAGLAGEAALRLARSIGWPRGEAQACNDLAILHMDRSDYPGADSLLRHALAIRTALHDSAGTAAVHNKLGIILQEQGRMEEALEENRAALAVYERIGPAAHEATVLNNIANLQFNLRRLPMALATHQRAAAIRERIGDQAGLAASQGNMANVQLQLGDTAPAIRNYQEAIHWFRAHGRKQELAVQLNNVAGVHLAQGLLAQAATEYGEALAIRTGLGDRKAIASSMTGLGTTMERQGRTVEAQRLLLGALAGAQDVGARPERLQTLRALARLHAHQGHGDSALAYQERYDALKDSIFNTDLTARLAEAEARYAVQKKERQLERQRADLAAQQLAIADLRAAGQRRTYLLVTAVCGIVMVALVALLLLQVQRRRAAAARTAAILTERSAGLQGVLQATEAERKRIAAELHDGVAQQITGLKFRLEEIAAKARRREGLDENTVLGALSIADEAGQEVRTIAHGLMPKALESLGLVPALEDLLERSLGGAGIRYEFGSHGLQGRLPDALGTGVYRIVQELTQNTLKHARANVVNVQLLENNGHLVLVYEDDGKGLPASTGSEGFGIRSMRERAHALGATLHLARGVEHGMTATLRVPLPVTA